MSVASHDTKDYILFIQIALWSIVEFYVSLYPYTIYCFVLFSIFAFVCMGTWFRVVIRTAFTYSIAYIRRYTLDFMLSIWKKNMSLNHYFANISFRNIQHRSFILLRWKHSYLVLITIFHLFQNMNKCAISRISPTACMRSKVWLFDCAIFRNHPRVLCSLSYIAILFW